MRSDLRVSFLMGCLLLGGLCHGEQVLLSNPLEVKLTYEGGLTVEMKKKEDGVLGFLQISMGKENCTVPPKEMADIFDPILSKVLLTGPRNGAEREICITLEFDYRHYEWGSAPMTVKFFFRNGRYSDRTVKIPTGPQSWKVIDKKVGEPEDDPGKK